ncbi:2-hydroxyacid dehydrogenase [Nitratireductor kimnyeongensis]|uniref:2-hydroxyacid dehydrogenase n=1 Tax=Nitratireductor kimnyeongensis TaxID=430679 RepID=A0ABW0T744_9HYPH|nr:2-hydroxyacid dehydrogenase [Nitratireductor kimnyeongensis]QZZ36348.1 2-hydroxyacid dehydrogenase [Nitratireductor kimnyeongensis]
MAETNKTAILVPGKLHAHAMERIGANFDLLTIEKAAPELVTEEMAEKVRGMAAMTVVDAAFIDALPNLEIIANFGVGYDTVDAGHASRRDVMVTNTPDILTEEVADTAVGLLLNTVREFPRAETWLRAGRWTREGGYPSSRGSLRGRTVGIFGMGRIGRAIAHRLVAFGLPIAYHNRRPLTDVPYAYHDTLVGLAAAVDTLICVAPGGAETHHAVNADVLKALGENGVFINIGRGSTVDEAALITALEKGTIFAAGLDVFENEPQVPEALIALENVSLLPHVGSASVVTRQAMADLVVDNLISWFTQNRAITPVPETVNVERRSASSSMK